MEKYVFPNDCECLLFANERMGQNNGCCAKNVLASYFLCATQIDFYYKCDDEERNWSIAIKQLNKKSHS